MKKRLIVILFLLVAVTSLAVAPVFATVQCRCYTQARGDYQILSNGPDGAVVRVWVLSSCKTGRFVYVTVVANALDGSPVTGAYTLWVPGYGSRPVDVGIDSEILHVNKLIVTSLGA